MYAPCRIGNYFLCRKDYGKAVRGRELLREWGIEGRIFGCKVRLGTDTFLDIVYSWQPTAGSLHRMDDYLIFGLLSLLTCYIVVGKYDFSIRLSISSWLRFLSLAAWQCWPRGCTQWLMNSCLVAAADSRAVASLRIYYPYFLMICLGK